MGLDIEDIYKKTWEYYQRCKENLLKKSLTEDKEIEAISDRIPGYKSSELDFGSYSKDSYAVLFVDMRNSSDRAQKVGPKKTFLTMHIYLTALLEVINYREGNVIDIMGDGLMVFWGGKKEINEDKITEKGGIAYAALCGIDMLKIRQKVINRLIKEEGLGDEINIGIGVSFGEVIVTKLGISKFYDIKAFGDCINNASKIANMLNNEIGFTNNVKELLSREIADL